MDFADFISAIRLNAKRAFFKENELQPVLYLYTVDPRITLLALPGLKIVGNGLVEVPLPSDVYDSTANKNLFVRFMRHIAKAHNVEMFALISEAYYSSYTALKDELTEEKLNEFAETAKKEANRRECLVFTFESRKPNEEYKRVVYAYSIDSTKPQNRKLSDNTITSDLDAFGGLFLNILKP